MRKSSVKELAAAGHLGICATNWDMSRPFSESYLGKVREKYGSALLQSPAARVVMEDSAGRVLFQMRRDFGVWGIPGGHPEERESIEQCLLREVREETGLELLEYRVFGHASDPQIEVCTYPNGHIVHSYALLFWATRWRGDLIASSDEASELRFMDPLALIKEAPESLLPNELITLQRFFEFKKTGQLQLY